MSVAVCSRTVMVTWGPVGRVGKTDDKDVPAVEDLLKINVLPRFLSQTAISQSERADEERNAFDRHPTVQTYFLSVTSLTPKG